MDLQTLQKRISEGEKFEFVFFWGHKAVPGKITDACFSQWFPSKFSDGRVEYNCMEQYMMARKALLFGDNEAYEEIMNESDPSVIKGLGRKVRNFDEGIWAGNCRRIVEEGNYFKFTQNEDLKKHLLATGDKILVEASPYDKIWGIKMRKEDPDTKDPFKWRGTNYLGFALTNVRERIKSE